MIDRNILSMLKSIRKEKALLSTRGLYFKSDSDVVNHAIRKLSESIRSV